MQKKLFVLILPILLTGCMHTVKYKLTDTDRWTGPKIQGTVCVQPITDHTVYGVTDWRPKHTETGTWINTGRGLYAHTNLTHDVTAMVAKHLSHSGLFTKVVTDQAKADFALSGSLTEFRASGHQNAKAEAIQGGFAAFGVAGALVGAAATADMKAEVKTFVKLDELQLVDKANRVVWRDSIAINSSTNVYFAEADSPGIYAFPDQGLKDAVTELIQRLGSASLTNEIAGNTK